MEMMTKAASSGAYKMHDEEEGKNIISRTKWSKSIENGKGCNQEWWLSQLGAWSSMHMVL